MKSFPLHFEAGESAGGDCGDLDLEVQAGLEDLDDLLGQSSL